MELLVNDLSLAGQYSNVSKFQDAIERVMSIRQIALQYACALRCSRNMSQASVTHEFSLIQAVQRLERNKSRAIMQWLDRYGPFWDEERAHGSNDYFECKGNVVTDSSVGEAAFGQFHDRYQRLVSFIPSEWAISSLLVTWVLDDDDRRDIHVDNYWDVESVEAALKDAAPPLASWDQLEQASRARYPLLKFAETCFAPLNGHPFVAGAAERILVLLNILNRLVSSHDKQGRRTTETHNLINEYFSGAKALFTDSSETEKNEFKNALSFPHPEIEKTKLFCPWHGKVKTPQIRIHFTWPVNAGDLLYVVYVGPKITKL